MTRRPRRSSWRKASVSTGGTSCTTTLSWWVQSPILRRSLASTISRGRCSRSRQRQAPFISRGDRSGTHAAELRLWTDAGIDIGTSKGTWYRETGSGMGAALNTAAAMDAYILTDRGTWLAFQNRGSLGIFVEGDKRLFNQYGVIMVNPAKHPHVKRVEAQAFSDWLVSPAGQAAIAAFRISGDQAFFPNAGPATR